MHGNIDSYSLQKKLVNYFNKFFPLKPINVKYELNTRNLQTLVLNILMHCKLMY